MDSKEKIEYLKSYKDKKERLEFVKVFMLLYRRKNAIRGRVKEYWRMC